MLTVSLFNAKTHLSRIVEDLLSGKEAASLFSDAGYIELPVSAAHAAATEKNFPCTMPTRSTAFSSHKPVISRSGCSHTTANSSRAMAPSNASESAHL